MREGARNCPVSSRSLWAGRFKAFKAVDSRFACTGHPAPLHEEFELVVMIGVAIEEMLGSYRIPDLRGLQGELWLIGPKFFL